MHSPRGVPYLHLDDFAQSLLETQQYADLADLVDGMDLHQLYGELTLGFWITPGLAEYYKEKNKRIMAAFKGTGMSPVLARLNENPKLWDRWLRIVNTKEKRINDELPREMYLTRFRKVGSLDPRQIPDREV